MGSKVIPIFILIWMCFGTFIYCEESEEDAKATYSVVASSKLRPNMDYHVSATVHDVPSPVQITVTLEGPADDGNYNSISKAALLNPRETQILKFEVGEWSSGNYSLTVRGEGGPVVFQNQTTLTFEPKSYSVFIQTDKAIYKPGQLVQFRVIVVNLYLLPSVTGAIEIFVTDANGNRIKQWNRQFTSKGIVSADLLLSDRPVLGDWTINVNVLGQTFKKSFTVAEYVLPTFDVQLTLPPYVTFNKSDAVATVNARYTYGKPVKGELVLTVIPNMRTFHYSDDNFTPFQVKTKIDGTKDVEVNIERDLNIQPSYFFHEILFTAEVVEELTGRKYNTSAVLKMHETDVKVELIKSSKTFKPGLKYTAYLKVAHQDDTPVTVDSDKLMLNYGYTFNEKEWKTSSYVVPSNGLIKLEFFPPHQNDFSALVLHAIYKNHSHHLGSIDAAQSPSNNFIQVTLITQNPQMDSDAELEVNATEPLSHLVIDVIGRGGIVYASTFHVPNKTLHHITFPISHTMAPRAHVVVYYVRTNNSEIVADAVNFEVPGVLRTPVKVDANIKVTKPGGKVDIEVETKPNALVGLLGIDQSVLLLKSGNDITEQDVIDEVDSYFPGTNRDVSPWYRRKKRSFWWPGSTTAGEIFDDSGLVILTNGLVHRYIELIMYRMNSMADKMEADFSNVLYNDLYNDNSVHSKSSLGIKVRKNFPETWLWNLTSADYDGKLVLSSHIPDTITSWIVSAFSMDSVTGLGISPEPAKVTVFRQFFVKLNLPYSIIRGESVAIQAIVFNYNNKPVEAKVTLENKNGQFDFITGNDIESSSTKEKTKSIIIPPQEGKSVTFAITPRKLGYIDIKVSAVSSLVGDAVIRKLLVKPEGTPQYYNKAILVDLRDAGSKPITAVVPIDIPAGAVKDSERITLSAIGDILGPSVNNLEQLLKMPFGCGEQNMVNFVPNIVVIEYLNRANRLTPAIEKKGIMLMEKGYQRELTYKRNDGSFSAFGNRDSNGSTWLTAFVIRSFHQAKPYISIDDKVIEQALQWLMDRQKKDGSFEEIGEVHHKAMQGGAGGGPALTAFVLVALLENQAQKKYPQQVRRTEDYIIKEVSLSNDPYMVAIATYALHLSDNVNKDNAFQKLQSLAQRKGNTVYWVKKEDTSKGKMSHSYSSQSQDVEMTSYALLTYAQRADVVGGIPIMRWLISQQNENGGYSSTQDTVVGIQALGKLAARLVSSTISMAIHIKDDTNRDYQLNITHDNALVLNQVNFDSHVRVVNLEASGFGVGIVQVSWSYNLAVPNEHPSFKLKTAVGKSSTDNYLKLDVCTNYEEEGATNMAVMEIVLPSGYAADSSAFPGIQQVSKVKQIDTSNGDSKVIVYFDRIDKEEICIVVPAFRNHKIANQKPVPVEVYDYYDLAKSARAFYQVKESKICDICDEEDCNDRCSSTSSNTPDSSDGIIANLGLLLTVILLTLSHQLNK